MQQKCSICLLQPPPISSATHHKHSTQVFDILFHISAPASPAVQVSTHTFSTAPEYYRQNRITALILQKHQKHYGEEVKLTPQQLIAQSTRATVDTLTDALTSQSALITLPTYDWAQ